MSAIPLLWLMSLKMITGRETEGGQKIILISILIRTTTAQQVKFALPILGLICLMKAMQLAEVQIYQLPAQLL